MSFGDVTTRIGEIRSQIALMSATAVAAQTRTHGVTSSAATTAGASGTGVASAAQFATALDDAVTAQQPASWVVPVRGKVTSGFGPRGGEHHAGIDLAAPMGTPIHAAGAGVVRKASWYGGYGNAVIIDHGNGVSTLYGHNSALTVKPGQHVKAGEVIAKLGSTGDSTGPHLHFEVKVDGKKVDPRPWLAAHGIKL